MCPPLTPWQYAVNFRHHTFLHVYPMNATVQITLCSIGVGGGGGGDVPPQKKKIWKRKHSVQKRSGKFACKSNGKFGKTEQVIFARNICRRYSGVFMHKLLGQISSRGIGAFARRIPLVLSLNFPPKKKKKKKKLKTKNSGPSNWEVRAKAMDKFWAKAMRKLEKRWDIFRAKIMEVWGNFTNLHIIFKIYFLDQIKILKDLASSARNSQYTWKYCIFIDLYLYLYL